MDSVAFEGNVEDIRGGAIGDAARRAKADALDDTRSWIDPRGHRLSERIWSARQSDRAAIQQILREAIAAGEDPLQAARRLEVYLTPDGQRLKTTAPPIRRGTPQEYRSGKGSYAARRLARTEITRAHGQATLQAAAENQFVTGVRWNLSPSHPKVDICDEHARRDRGLGPGVYRVEDVPRYPAHPHCLCNLAPVVAEDAIDRIVAETRAARVRPVAQPEPMPLPMSASSPLPTVPVPTFKTVAEATEWATANLKTPISSTGKAKVELVQQVVQALANLEARTGNRGFPSYVAFSSRKVPRNAVAVHRHNDRTVYLRETEIDWAEMKASNVTALERTGVPWTVYEDVEAIVAHELAHALDKANFLMQAKGIEWSKFYGKATQVSGYAKTLPEEWWAEAFAAVATGSPRAAFVPAEVQAFIRREFLRGIP